MPKPLVTLLGKSVQSAMRLRGGGSALPGLVVERIDPSFIRTTLAQLPQGVVLISGTNGKTTTTKMVVELLEGQGLKVFTNRTGSNFTRGVVAALLGDVDMKGRLQADIAVLELDEAHAVHFVKAIQPRFALFLNVMRDQLDRFGEIDSTAKLLRTVAEHVTEGVVVNRDDPRLGAESFVEGLDAPVFTYGVAKSLLSAFPSDDALHSSNEVAGESTIKHADVSLEKIHERRATLQYDGHKHEVDLKLHGIYNVLNAVGAVALCRLIMGDGLDEAAMLSSLANVEPAFGRGETLLVHGQPLELVLVKNPGGFRLGLSSFSPTGYATMIAINDNYADGRDMSWLWDVDFSSLQTNGVAHVAGIRAYDMALRLQYDDVKVGSVETDLGVALTAFLAANDSLPKRIYCTYTAMLALRRELGKVTKVEVIS